VEKIVKDHFLLDFDYALMPDIMNGLKKLDLEIIRQSFDERGQIEIAIRQTETTLQLQKLKASIWKVSVEEATGLDWPGGMKVDQH
jgi:hypothetical protein